MRIQVETTISQNLNTVWFHMVNWNLYSRWIPITKMINPEETTYSGKIGERFIGRTGVGFLSFDDPMIVVESRSPYGKNLGHASLKVLKTGNLVKGTAGFNLTVIDATSTKLVWWEDIQIVNSKFTELFAWAIKPLGTLAFQQVVNKIAKDLKN